MNSRNGNHKGPPQVLLVGYNGANNTGAEALLLSDIADVRAVLGDDARITIPSLNPANLKRYVQEGPYLRIAPIPTIYPLALRNLVREHDLIMLVEGSTYMDTWTSAMLWAYLLATKCADDMGKPSLAYAVDAGNLSDFNRRLVRREASKTDLIITRAQAAADRLRACGVTAPIETTADNAFTFRPDVRDEGWVERVWPESAGEMVGLAVVNFYLWPVVMRPWGRREDCYKWPYYYSTSQERRQATEALVDGYAALADCLAKEHGKAVALICMEQLDEPLARKIHARMAHPGRARVFSSREYNASQMTVLLRSLEFLITSRYHACVLSLAAQVPQVAMGHDLRLKTIYDELGFREQFFVDPTSTEPCRAVKERLEKLLADPVLEREALRRGYEEHLAQAQRNRALLRTFVQEHGWEVVA
jgi:polysaccharide pyruvyl transferase WcaK-like protein